MPFIQNEVVKYFIDRFKATGPYKRNNTNNYNKITNTTLYQYKKITITVIEQFGMSNTHIYSEAGRFYDCSSLAAECIYIDALTQEYLVIRRAPFFAYL